MIMQKTNLKMNLEKTKDSNQLDIRVRQLEFASIDKSNPDQLKNWFIKYRYLSTNDHAQIAQKSTWYIRKLKRLAGLTTKSPTKKPIPKPIYFPSSIVVATDWDTEAWLSKAINIYTISAIAKACGVSPRTIRRRVKYYSISKIAKPRIKNKCFTKEWCYLHYIKLGWNQTKCAQKAGICQQTFVNWLNYFNIPVRTAQASLVACTNHKLWVKQLYHDLQQQPIVSKVFLRSDHIHVRFKDYFWESYYFDGKSTIKRPIWSYFVTPEDSMIKCVPVVLPEHESDCLDTILDQDGLIKSPHLIISRHKLNASSFVEQRLAIHDFCRHVTQRGWIWPEHPIATLNRDLQQINRYNTIKYIKKDVYDIYAHLGCLSTPGRKIIEHFFDLSDHANTFTSPRLVIKILNILLSKKRLKFNTHNMLRIYSSGAAFLPGNRTQLRIFDPASYAVIFKRLRLSGSILDLTPGYGNKAIAAALAGLQYYTIPTIQFTKAIDKGFADFCKIDYAPWDNQNVDLLLYDNQFMPPDMGIVDKYMDHAKRLMVYVPRHLKELYTHKLKPDLILQIRTRSHQPPDYLFIW